MTLTSRLLLSAAAAMLVAIGMGGCSKPPAVAAASPAASSPDTHVADVDVTEHVKTALIHDESLKGAEISVVTTKGDVRLTGTLDSQTQIDDAIKLARAADGAHTVHDELTIKK